jgi:DNA-binding NtrC family response regulator
MPDIKPHSHKSILLVEDDPPIRGVIAATLQYAGYNVTCAWKAIDVTGMLAQHAFDLIITDMLMPDMDGTEVILAAKRIRPDTPVVAMSGGGTFVKPDLSLAIAKAAGAIEVLEKPFSAERLLEAVEKALKRDTPKE